MNVIDAAHLTVKSYPGGAEALGPRVEIGAAVLRSKVNPNTTTHHLTLAEADRMMGVTGDYRILQALAAEHGFVLQKAEVEQQGSILQAVLQANSARGEFHRKLEVALADGDVSPNELRDLMSAFLDEQAKDMRVMACAAAMSGQRPEAREVR